VIRLRKTLHLRNVSHPESYPHQALRLGVWTGAPINETTPRVVVSTTGGSVIVVDPHPHLSDGTIVGELDPSGTASTAGGDHGYRAVDVHVLSRVARRAERVGLRLRTWARAPREPAVLTLARARARMLDALDPERVGIAADAEPGTASRPHEGGPRA
jgi:hypothetical protein